MAEKNNTQLQEAPEKMHLECLVHAATEAFQPSVDRTPQPGDWGVASYYDGPPAFCGAGMVGFCWFATKEEMARCLGEHGAFLSPGLDDDELTPVLELMREIGAYLGDGRVAPEKACEAFNKVLEGITKFTWIGSFDELCTGDTEYARNMRGQFRDHLACYDDDFDDESENAAEGGASAAADQQAPITEAEREGFIEFLVEGMVRGHSLVDWVQAGRFATLLDNPADGREFQRADSAPINTRGDGRLSVADWVQAGRFFARLDGSPQSGGPTAPEPPAPFLAFTDLARVAERGWRFVNLNHSGFSPLRGGFIDVELNAVGDENSLGFTVNFDPSQLRFLGIERGADASRAMLQSSSQNATEGEIGFALAMPPGQNFEAGKRQLVRLRFQPLRTNEDISIGFGDGGATREIVDANAEVLPSRFEGMTIRFDPAARRRVKILQ